MNGLSQRLKLAAGLMNFLHKHYLSRKDIEACLACDLSEFDASPFRGEVEALMRVLQTKAEE